MAVIHLDHCSCGHEYHALGRCEVCRHDPHRDDSIERTPEDGRERDEPNADGA